MAVNEMVHSMMAERSDRSAHEHQRVDGGMGPWDSTGGGVSCKRCHAYCANKTEMWRHKRAKHGDGVFMDCPYPGCGRRFGAEFANIMHMRHHLAAGTWRVYTCEVCGHQARNRVSLGRHMDRAHPEARDAVCGICCMYMDDVASLIEHMRAMHMALMAPEHAGIGGPYMRPKRIARCDVCGKRCVSEAMVRAHRHVHGLASTDRPLRRRYPGAREMR